jgi:predicted hotdog family 3-hydroxylacyl-ACP dehydratase
MEKIKKTAEELEQVKVEELLPQRPPFIMIEKLIEYDEELNVTSTMYHIASDNPFVKDGVFQPSGIVENMAQTCAARIGYYDKLRNMPVRVGLIGGIKNLNVYQLPKTGDEITTHIVIKEDMLGVILASAKVLDHMLNLMADCELKIALK